MEESEKLYLKCLQCSGTGKVPTGVLPPGVGLVDCGHCSGTGYIETGEIDVTVMMTKLDWIKKKIKKIMKKLEIEDEE